MSIVTYHVWIERRDRWENINMTWSHISICRLINDSYLLPWEQYLWCQYYEISEDSMRITHICSHFSLFVLHALHRLYAMHCTWFYRQQCFSSGSLFNTLAPWPPWSCCWWEVVSYWYLKFTKSWCGFHPVIFCELATAYGNGH